MTAEPRCWGGGGVSHPSQLTTGLVIKSVTTSPTLAGERMLFILQVSILSEQLRASHNCVLTLLAPLLASKGMVSRSAGTSIRHSNRTTQTSRSAATTAFPSVSRKSPYASSDCVATLRRFASQAGFSATVAGQLASVGENLLD